MFLFQQKLRYFHKYRIFVKQFFTSSMSWHYQKKKIKKNPQESLNPSVFYKMKKKNTFSVIWSKTGGDVGDSENEYYTYIQIVLDHTKKDM